MSASQITLEHWLPASVEAERTILGAILLDNAAYDEALAGLGTGDFSLDSHRTIFRHCGEMLTSGKSIDIVTLSAQLERTRELENVGNRAYLFSLTENLPRRLSITDYVRIVKDKSILRQVMQICTESATFAAAQDRDGVDVLEQTRSCLEAILSDSATEKTEVSAYSGDVLAKWVAERRKPSATGISYGIETLDSRTGGMYPGENTTVGGDPGHGKSSFMLQAVTANCPKGIPVFLVSLEMTRDQVLKRLWANTAGIAPSKLRRPKTASDSEEQDVMEAAASVSEWPLHIYDKSTVKLRQLTGMLRVAIRKFKVKLFVVDFAQIVAAGGKDFREQVSMATCELTAIAKGEGVHLMLLSQMARKGHGEWNRPPRLSDLRESGALEQNAHCVVLIHRPWDEANGRIHTQAATHDAPGCELIVAKQREGSTSAFPVEFDTRTLAFRG